MGAGSLWPSKLRLKGAMLTCFFAFYSICKLTFTHSFVASVLIILLKCQMEIYLSWTKKMVALVYTNIPINLGISTNQKP